LRPAACAAPTPSFDQRSKASLSPSHAAICDAIQNGSKRISGGSSASTSSACVMSLCAPSASAR
jgi:hypothetical protein